MGIVYFIPVAFTACSPHSKWCALAFAFTSSGGPVGFLVMLLITGLGYASTAPRKRDKTMVFFKSIITLVLFFGVLAFVNERFTKHIIKAQRPSHVYMLNQAGLGAAIDSLYSLDKEERKAFFAELIKNNPLKFEQIDTEIQNHWIDESGFSFPSGHTFNAFLFAMILAYAIYFNRSRPALRNLFLIPFAWALAVGVSRVAMGAHSAFDVSAGAALGIMTGALFLYIDLTRHWLTRKSRI
ncbi:MAG TPA: phosphatase PAP2 family protein [Bacteroidia bacterium]|nr:phosphatase PAP2 family protein [Bacteroidia bacterium]